VIWLWSALLVVGVVLVAYTLTRVLAGGLLGDTGTTSISGRSSRPPSDDAAAAGPSRARQILDERYAAGELSTQEYEHRRAVLSGRQEES
jgi:putative membrane protein